MVQVREVPDLRVVQERSQMACLFRFDLREVQQIKNNFKMEHVQKRAIGEETISNQERE